MKNCQYKNGPENYILAIHKKTLTYVMRCEI